MKYVKHMHNLFFGQSNENVHTSYEKATYGCFDIL